ncbi:MAG TPA: hypothetical protein VN442_16355 [Bryobacteraceae bacterium]|nr:hypothetical protein [Bryobacteraceae bacterium]
MAQTVVGLFDEREQAERGVSDLLAAGFSREVISIVTGDRRTAADTPKIGPLEHTEAGMEAGRDAAVGGIAGLVVGMVALAIPGIGPLIAAGPIAAAIGGATIGAAAGGLVGALRDHGVSDEEAEFYAEGLRRGGTIVAVDTEDRENDASSIMKRAGAADIVERVEEWRAAGWTGGLRTRRAG